MRNERIPRRVLRGWWSGIVAILLLFPAHAAVASDTRDRPDLGGLSLEELLEVPVVVATRHPEKTVEVPATVYVVSRDQIWRYGYRTLGDVLASIPGMELADPDFFLFGGQRGFTGNFSQSLLMINGREVQNLLAGEAFISHQFRMHNVERVEVFMGPASALYGANAYVGVINIVTVTEDAEYEGSRVGLWAGSWDTAALDFTWARNFGPRKRAAASFHLFDTESEDFTDFVSDRGEFARGVEAIDEGRRRLPAENPRFPYRNPGRALIGSGFARSGSFYGGFEWFRNESGGGMESALFVSPTRDDVRELGQLFAGYEDGLGTRGRVRVELQWAREDIESEFPGPFDPDSPAGSAPVSHNVFFARGSERWRINPQVRYSFPESHSEVIGGLVYERLEIGAPGVATTVDGVTTVTDTIDPAFDFLLTSDETSAYGQYQRSFRENRFRLTLGARLDYHDLFGESINPRLGFVWRAYPDGVLKFLYGRAFREPNVFETFRSLETEDDLLEPTTLDTVEVSWLHEYGGLAWHQLALFVNRGDDVLVETILPGNVSVFRNRGERTVWGIESLARYRRGSLRGFFNTSVEFPDDSEVTIGPEGRPFVVDSLNIATVKANLGLDYTFRRGLVLALLNRYVSDVDTLTLDSGGDPTVETIPSFLVTGLTASWREATTIGKAKLDLSVTVDNLFDREYFHPQPRTNTPVKFRQNGRSGFLRGVLRWGGG